MTFKTIINTTILLSTSVLFFGCGSSDGDSTTEEVTTPEPITQTQTIDTTIKDSSGLVYETVTSPYTSRVWLDRNLGASQVCQSFDDEKCYGDYYQWGRSADGHQKLTSTTDILADDVENVGHDKFIINPVVDESVANDWSTSEFSDGSIRSYNWSKTDGSSVCPAGFRVPTALEISEEVKEVSNITDAFDNFLKLPASGFAAANDGIVHYPTLYGTIWSSSTDGEKSIHFGYAKDYVQKDDVTFRGGGFSLRCIKD